MTNENEVLELAKKHDFCPLKAAWIDGNIGYLCTPEQLYSFAAALEEKRLAQNNYLGHITDNELISELNIRFGFEPIGYVRQYAPDCLRGTQENNKPKSSTRIDPEPIADDDIPLFRLPSHTDAIEAKYQSQIAMLTDLLKRLPTRFDAGMPSYRIEVNKVLGATQQSSDAFLAEVRAKAIRQFIEKFSFEDAVNQYRCQYCKDDDGEGSGLPLADALCAVGMPFANAQSEVELLADYIGGAMLDELRNSAAQPEGKDGK